MDIYTWLFWIPNQVGNDTVVLFDLLSLIVIPCLTRNPDISKKSNLPTAKYSRSELNLNPVILKLPKIMGFVFQTIILP